MKLINIAGFDVLEADERMSWNNAIAFPSIANAQKTGGFSDWVLPDVDVLKALQRIDEQKEGWFWSSSPGANDSYYAWGVNFDVGYVDYYVKGNGYRVRLVRAEQCLALVNETVAGADMGKDESI